LPGIFIECPQPECVCTYDIKAYLEEKIAEFHMAVLQKGVEIQLKAEADMPQVWMDRDKMDHIVDNLLSLSFLPDKL